MCRLVCIYALTWSLPTQPDSQHLKVSIFIQPFSLLIVTVKGNMCLSTIVTAAIAFASVASAVTTLGGPDIPVPVPTVYALLRVRNALVQSDLQSWHTRHAATKTAFAASRLVLAQPGVTIGIF
jgi:hypothetical protein